MSSSIVAVSPAVRQRAASPQGRRQNRAATIAAVGRVAVLVEGGAYRVASQTRPGAAYEVTRGAAGWECSCEDHDGQLSGGCKHARAVDLLDRAIALARAAQAEGILETAEAEIVPAIAEAAGSLDTAERIARRAIRWVETYSIPAREEEEDDHEEAFPSKTALSSPNPERLFSRLHPWCPVCLTPLDYRTIGYQRLDPHDAGSCQPSRHVKGWACPPCGYTLTAAQFLAEEER
ncbi:MAG: hypothetical protein M5U01_09990 [Ardenticatenaceae bacterium]|nr:hypothetical protein [Ardenticatenaceae bacterium]